MDGNIRFIMQKLRDWIFEFAKMSIYDFSLFDYVCLLFRCSRPMPSLFRKNSRPSVPGGTAGPFGETIARLEVKSHILLLFSCLNMWINTAKTNFS